MANAVLEKEIETLPPAAISEVIDFIRLIKLKFSDEKSDVKKNLYTVFGKMKNFICLPILMNP